MDSNHHHYFLETSIRNIFTITNTKRCILRTVIKGFIVSGITTGAMVLLINIWNTFKVANHLVENYNIVRPLYLIASPIGIVWNTLYATFVWPFIWYRGTFASNVDYPFQALVKPFVFDGK